MYITKFLTAPLQTLANVILQMSEFPTLMKYLKFKKRREVAKHITKAIARGGIDMCDPNIVKEVLIFIQPVLKKEADYQDISEALFKDEQVQVAKIVFLIQSEDPSIVWDILKTFAEQFLEGGEERMKYTLPSMVFRLIQLVVQIFSSEDRPEAKGYKKIIEMIRKLIEKLSTFQPILSIKLYLELLLLVNHFDETKFYDEWCYVNFDLFLGNCRRMSATLRGTSDRLPAEAGPSGADH
jgi:vacuolar protein sorting-associated protein 35